MNEFGIEVGMPRHETAVSHNAWEYAESGGEVAGTIVIPGTGDMNVMNGLKNVLNDCPPLIHTALETEPSARGGDGIHETPPATYDNVVNESSLVEVPTDPTETQASEWMTQPQKQSNK